eukprot:12657355-Prorocentrum_lima.AAC.1
MQKLVVDTQALIAKVVKQGPTAAPDLMVWFKALEKELGEHKHEPACNTAILGVCTLECGTA